MTNEEYAEYLQQMREQQHAENFSRVDYGSGDKFLADEINYTADIITDDVYDRVRKEFGTLFLKKRTVAMIDRLMRATTTKEIVINNYTYQDVMSEKIGVKKNTLYAMCNISALEKKYNDADLMLIYNNVHHRTKVTRGRLGFERGVQKTSIVKSHAYYDRGEQKEQPKTGISRYVPIGRR